MARARTILLGADFFPETRMEPESEKDERYTPSSVFLPLNQEFRFTLDACATRESAKCTRYVTKEEDGLMHSWAGERVFCNPPYSDIRPWVQKAWRTRAELVVMLVPGWTDRDWWAELVEPFRDGKAETKPLRLTTRFLRGRVRFGFPGNPQGLGVNSPPFWCCLLVWQRIPTKHLPKEAK